MLSRIFELLTIAFFIGIPVHLIASIGQWVIQFRLIPDHQVKTTDGIKCIFLTLISSYFLSLVIWILWPLHPDLILYHDRLSVPATIAELICMPFWIRHYGYL